jgi:hypothetical protein
VFGLMVSVRFENDLARIVHERVGNFRRRRTLARVLGQGYRQAAFELDPSEVIPDV